jgi:hypothetical protein
MIQDIRAYTISVVVVKERNKGREGKGFHFEKLESQHKVGVPVSDRRSSLSFGSKFLVFCDVVLSPAFPPRFVLPHTVGAASVDCQWNVIAEFGQALL